MGKKKDLYAALGVDRAAPKDAVKKAFRKRVRQTHPDAGGTKEAFALVSLAHDVLTDDVRRAHYDQTSDYDSKPVDNELAAVASIVAQAMQKAVEEILKQNASTKHKNVLEKMKQVLLEAVKEAKNHKTALQGGRKELAEAAARFTSSLPPEEDLVQMAARHHLKTLDQEIANCDRHLKRLDKAIEVVKAYTYRVDKQPSASYSSGGWESAGFIKFTFGG